MQRSIEGSSLSSNGNGGGNFHSRNQQAPGGGFDSQFRSYGGGASAPDTSSADWKSKIVESGQWLGGKVIEYGGRLARAGSSHDTIPDHMNHQMPRNDGRASWMADIRNSNTQSSSFSNGGGGGGGGYQQNNMGGAVANRYQNDFATERPRPYADAQAFSSSK